MDEILLSLKQKHKEREVLENEIADLHMNLTKMNVTMTESLVDGEGYPRSDIDIYLVRQIRHNIICKQNDCKNLTDVIEKLLHDLHETARVTPSAACLNVQDIFEKPFARVEKVDDNSPAQKAGLEVGDLVIKFGRLKFRDFKNLNELHLVAELVQENVKKQIHVNVLRKAKVETLVLVPDKWEGAGYLGCLIRPISR